MLTTNHLAIGITVLVLVTPCHYAAADVESGIAAYQRGDYAAALAEFSVAARQNDPLAMNVLGIMYAEGRAIERNDKLAVDLFFRAQALGSLEAGANLGRMYADGRGVPQSNTEALKHYRDAALGGYVPAMRRLADVYEKGDLGVAPDPVQSREWRARLGGTPAGLMQVRPAPKETVASPEIPRDKKPERKVVPAAIPVPMPASRAASVVAQADQRDRFEKQVFEQTERYHRRERKLQVASTESSPVLGSYLTDLRTRLKQQLQGTFDAAKAQAGMTVSLTVLRDGTLRGIEVDRTSGDTGHDRKVLAALKRLGRLPPLPVANDETPDVLEVTVRLPIE